jgi:hypothetical protein
VKITKQEVKVKITKREVKEELSIKITSNEWKEIKLHARYSGPFNPVKQVSSFCNQKLEAILTCLIEYLNHPGNLQRYAFGQKLMALFNNQELCELDAVDRLKKLEQLSAKFIIEMLSELDQVSLGALPEPEDHCPKCDPKLQHYMHHQCMKEKIHEGRCKFTPKGSICMSAAT